MNLADIKPIALSAADEDSHFQVLSAADRAAHFQDHIGIGVFGRAGGMDIGVTSTIYHIGGAAWSIDDAAVIQTNFLLSDPSDRKMGNNHFVGNRLDSSCAFDNFQIERTGDKVVWKAGNRQTICYPPHWEIKGEHMGVEVDIKLTALGDALPYRGPWDKLAETGMAGNELLARAEGQVTYDGETYVLDEAYAVRERMCLGKGKDVMSLLGATPGYLWGWIFADRFKMFCHAAGVTGKYMARVYLDDEIVEFGPDEVFVERLESWIDPMSNVTYDVAWRVRIESERGELEVSAATFSRCLFGFFQVRGYSLHMGALGRASGRFAGADGDVISLDDVTCYFDQGKATLLPAGAE